MEDWVQIKNPRTNRWVKIRLFDGKKVYKKSEGRYKNIPIYKRKAEGQ